MPSKFPLRVYYEDTDAGGVVYYANYLKFAERARTEALRQAGIEQETLLREQSVAFVVRSCNAEFLKPARLDDLLTIETRLHDIGSASLTLQQCVMLGSTPLVNLTVKIGVVNAAFRPTRLPQGIRESMKKVFE